MRRLTDYIDANKMKKNNSKNPDAENWNVLSLFAGCGGLDYGFKLAENKDIEFKIVWANDILEHACRTFAGNFKLPFYENFEKSLKNLPAVYCGDVREVDFTKINIRENIDIVTGGFPCQDFSLLRGNDNRKGIEVKRGRLYLQYTRALIETQPKFFVAENVKGLISANEGKAYERIKEDFKHLDIHWKNIEEECKIQPKKDDGVKGYTLLFSDVVDFSKLGVPQMRERLIIIGIRNDLAEKIENIGEVKKELRNSLTKNTVFSKCPLTVMEAFEGKPISELNNYEMIMKAYEPYIKNISSERQKKYLSDIWSEYSFNAEKDYLQLNNCSEDLETVSKKHKEILEELGFLNDPLNKKSFPDKSNKIAGEIDRVVERMKHIPPGENHNFVRDTDHHVSGLMSNIYRRTHPLKPSPTIIACGGGGTWGYHYNVTRQKLTNRERARIQTFPDDFKFTGKFAEVRTQIGNAVPPLAGKRIAENILKILDKINR